VEEKAGRNGNRRKEKGWRKEDEKKGDQTRTSMKRKAADVTLPTDVQIGRAEAEEREKCGCRVRAGRGMDENTVNR